MEKRGWPKPKYNGSRLTNPRREAISQASRLPAVRNLFKNQFMSEKGITIRYDARGYYKAFDKFGNMSYGRTFAEVMMAARSLYASQETVHNMREKLHELQGD